MAVKPMLKAEQVLHIINGCNVHLLMMSPERLRLPLMLARCPKLCATVLTGAQAMGAAALVRWWEFDPGACLMPARGIDAYSAAISYTSGGTGKPKGVVLSHRDMVAAAISVVSYPKIIPADRLLALLRLSFGYGLSQLINAFYQRATAVLINLFSMGLPFIGRF